METESTRQIRQLARRLDNSIERHDMDAVLSFFTEDCEVTFFGAKVSGKERLQRALRFLFDKLVNIRFEPVTIMVEGETFFEEFRLHAEGPKTESVSIEAAEVLVYDGDKVKSMRLYLDRLQLAGVIVEGMFERKLLHAIEKKTLEGFE
jgi:ketosteroid isomerase-like protein